MRFCKDCKFAERKGLFFKTVSEYSKCKNPKYKFDTRKTDLVTGKRIGDVLDLYCLNAREFEQYCGQEAVGFEPYKK